MLLAVKLNYCRLGHTVVASCSTRVEHCRVSVVSMNLFFVGGVGRLTMPSA